MLGIKFTKLILELFQIIFRTTIKPLTRFGQSLIYYRTKEETVI